MKSKFCFIRKPQGLHPGDFVYHVYVGSSGRELTKLALIREFCKDCGLYLKKWSADVDTTLSLAAQSWRSKDATLTRPFKSCRVNVHELYELIINDSFDAYEANHIDSHFSIWLSHHENPVFVAAENKKNLKQSCSNPHSEVLLRAHLPRRKNLSYGELTPSIQVACYFGFILLMFMVEGWLERVCM